MAHRRQQMVKQSQQPSQSTPSSYQSDSDPFDSDDNKELHQIINGVANHLNLSGNSNNNANIRNGLTSGKNGRMNLQQQQQQQRMKQQQQKKYSGGNNNMGNKKQYQKQQQQHQDDDEYSSSSGSSETDTDDDDDVAASSDEDDRRTSSVGSKRSKGNESAEDYSDDEDEGEDGYRVGGYHRVKVGEVYNQR